MKCFFSFGTAVLCILTVYSSKAQDNPAQADSFARIVFKSIAQNDYALFESTMLPLEAWSYYGPEWDSLPGNKKTEIQAEVKNRLRSNFNKVIADAKKNHVSLKKIAYDGVKTESNPEFKGYDGTELAAMEIYFTYNGKRGNFAIAVLKAHGRLYTSEILKITDIFVKVK